MNTTKNINLTSFDELLDKQYGKRGTEKRNDFENKFEGFKFGFSIKQARIEKGLTKKELAEKCGTNKSYISKVENNIKDVKLSTLRKIVEKGLGGKVEIGISL